MKSNILILGSAAAIALVLSACGSNPVAPEANNSSMAEADLGQAARAGGSAGGGAPPIHDGSVGDDRDPGPATAAIPVSLQGRWGMVPADCTSTRGDAKGLITIDGDSIRFYESVARPGSDVQASGNSVSGRFNFTGEGMNWTRYQALEVQDGKLVRTENDPASSYTYIRCT